MANITSNNEHLTDLLKKSLQLIDLKLISSDPLLLKVKKNIQLMIDEQNELPSCSCETCIKKLIDYCTAFNCFMENPSKENADKLNEKLYATFPWRSRLLDISLMAGLTVGSEIFLLTVIFKLMVSAALVPCFMFIASVIVIAALGLCCHYFLDEIPSSGRLKITNLHRFAEKAAKTAQNKSTEKIEIKYMKSLEFFSKYRSLYTEDSAHDNEKKDNGRSVQENEAKRFEPKPRLT